MAVCSLMMVLLILAMRYSCVYCVWWGLYIVLVVCGPFYHSNPLSPCLFVFLVFVSFSLIDNYLVCDMPMWHFVHIHFVFDNKIIDLKSAKWSQCQKELYLYFYDSIARRWFQWC